MSATQPVTEALPDQKPEEPVAVVHGEQVMQLPHDLYIPPDALEVFLDAFEGPLDLLLYLIKKQNLDILDIPIAAVTKQYIEYISVMEFMRLELAAEYLLMAAMLAEIKSRMLLPRAEEIEDEDDPRAELIRRLQEYEQLKTAAEGISEMPRLERNNLLVSAALPELQKRKPEPDVDLRELLLSFQDIMRRVDQQAHHQISRETISTRERMSVVLSDLSSVEFVEFSTLFKPEQGRLGVVVSFLAILTLIKEALVDIQQAGPFAPIYLRARGSHDPDGGNDDLDDDDDDNSGEDPFEPPPEPEPELVSTDLLEDDLELAES